MILTARLPVRFTDTLEIEVDADAAGKRLTPAQALALAERLTHQAVTAQADAKRRLAARPKVAA